MCDWITWINCQNLAAPEIRFHREWRRSEMMMMMMKKLCCSELSAHDTHTHTQNMFHHYIQWYFEIHIFGYYGAAVIWRAWRVDIQRFPCPDPVKLHLMIKMTLKFGIYLEFPKCNLIFSLFFFCNFFSAVFWQPYYHRISLTLNKMSSQLTPSKKMNEYQKIVKQIKVII